MIYLRAWGAWLHAPVKKFVHKGEASVKKKWIVRAACVAAACALTVTGVAAAGSAVWLHGRAGDLAAAALTEYAMTPMDMIGRIGAAFASVQI